MDIIKKYKKVFIGIAIVSLLLSIVPILSLMAFEGMRVEKVIEHEVEESVKEIN